MLPSNFIVSGVKISGYYPLLISNIILFSNLFKYVLIGGLSVTVSCFLIIYSKYSSISDTEYGLSSNSTSPFHVGADSL